MNKILLIFCFILSLNLWAGNLGSGGSQNRGEAGTNIFEDLGEFFENANQKNSTDSNKQTTDQSDQTTPAQSNTTVNNPSAVKTTANDNNELLTKLKIVDIQGLENDYAKYVEQTKDKFLQTKLSRDGKVMATVTFNKESKLHDFRLWKITKSKDQKKVKFGDTINYDIQLLTAFSLPQIQYDYSLDDIEKTSYVYDNQIYAGFVLQNVLSDKLDLDKLNLSKVKNKNPRPLNADQIALSDDGKLIAFAFRNEQRTHVDVVVYEVETGKIMQNHIIPIGSFSQYFAYDVVLMCGISFVPNTANLAVCHKDLSKPPIGDCKGVDECRKRYQAYLNEPFRVSIFNTDTGKKIKTSPLLGGFQNGHSTVYLDNFISMVGPMKFSDDGKFFTINSYIGCSNRFYHGSKTWIFKSTRRYNSGCHTYYGSPKKENEGLDRHFPDHVFRFNTETFAMIDGSSRDIWRDRSLDLDFYSKLELEQRGLFEKRRQEGDYWDKAYSMYVGEINQKHSVHVLTKWRKKGYVSVLDYEFLSDGQTVFISDLGVYLLKGGQKYQKAKFFSKDLFFPKTPWRRPVMYSSKTENRDGYGANHPRDYLVSSSQKNNSIWLIDKISGSLTKLSVKDGKVKQDLYDYRKRDIVDLKAINDDEVLFIGRDKVFSRYFPNGPEEQKAIANLDKAVDLMQNGFDDEGVNLFTQTANDHRGVFFYNALLGNEGNILGSIIGGPALFKEYYQEPTLPIEALIQLHGKHELNQIKRYKLVPATETAEEKADRLNRLSLAYMRYLLVASRLGHYGLVEAALKEIKPVLDDPGNTEFKLSGIIELLEANLVAAKDPDKAYSELLKKELKVGTLVKIGALNSAPYLKKDPKKICYILKEERYCKFYTRSYPIESYDYFDLKGQVVKSASAPKKLENIAPKTNGHEKPRESKNQGGEGAIVLD